MNVKQLRTATLTALLASVTLVFSPSNAHAISCGDTLGPGGHHVLTQDLLNCTSNALFIEGPTSVDLAGHTISCVNPSSSGLKLTGQKAKVTNGTVFGCGEGVYIGGAGKHQVSKIIALQNYNGFSIASDGNRLTRNTAKDSEVGFLIGTVHKNVLTYNVATMNDSGFFVGGGTKNRLFHNIAIQNGDEGFLVHSNAAETTLSKNEAHNNGEFGIVVWSDASHKIIGNTAINNTSFDLHASLPGCISNVWKKNTYGTKDPDCIQ